MIIQMNFYNFVRFHTFVSKTKINIPLEVPHLLALGHIYSRLFQPRLILIDQYYVEITRLRHRTVRQEIRVLV